MLKDTTSLAKYTLILFVGFLILITTFTIHFDWPEGIVYFDRFIYLNRFFVDFFQVCAAILLLSILGKLGRIAAIVVTFTFVGFYFVQSESYATIGKFMPAVALENADHVDFLNIDNIVFSGVLWVFFTALVINIARKSLIGVSWKPALSLVLILLLISVAIKNDKKWLSDETLSKRFEFYNSGRAGVEHKSPLSALLKTYSEHLKYLEKQRFITDRADELSETAAEFAYNNFDFFGKQDIKYPLMRTTRFETPFFLKHEAPKESNESSKEKKPKNIIIVFSEGFSARLMQPYSKNFDQLTPNINEFSKKALRVDNYYNHTYATYRGLGGQLCSIFPVGRLYKEVDYYCLGHALQDQGYRTRFMVSQTLTKTDLDQVFKQAGIQEVDGLKNVSELTSHSNENSGSIVSDAILFEALILRLKQEDEQKVDEPFMIGVYNFQTHTGVNLNLSNGAYVGSASQPREPNYVLDTFHNFDKAFGAFWDYFKNSDHYKDTVVVLTTDHATFPGRDYVQLVEKEDKYSRLFIDQIPLLIYHPDVSEALIFDAQSSTSLDFAPSILNLLDFPETKAPFLGQTIFSETRRQPMVNVGGGASRMWYTDTSRAAWGNVSEKNYEEARKSAPEKATVWEFIKYAESLERSNHLWKK